jgi:hypothetical protein
LVLLLHAVLHVEPAAGSSSYQPPAHIAWSAAHRSTILHVRALLLLLVRELTLAASCCSCCMISSLVLVISTTSSSSSSSRAVLVLVLSLHEQRMLLLHCCLPLHGLHARQHGCTRPARQRERLLHGCRKHTAPTPAPST